jgi:hypothetical protein
MGNQTLMRYPKVSVSWALVLPRSRLFNPAFFRQLKAETPPSITPRNHSGIGRGCTSSLRKFSASWAGPAASGSLAVCCLSATLAGNYFVNLSAPQSCHSHPFDWSMRSREDVFTGERKSKGRRGSLALRPGFSLFWGLGHSKSPPSKAQASGKCPRRNNASVLLAHLT